MNLFKSTLSTKKVILLLRSIGVMLKAGVPLVRVLTIMENDTPKRKRAIITHLRKNVETGRPLAESMENSGAGFPPIAINLVRTGELSGTLEKSLTAIVKHLCAAQELKRKIRGAMMYPMFVLIAVAAMGLSVGIFVLPKLIPLFESLNVDLPFNTRVILWCARVFSAYGLWIGLSMVIGGGIAVTAFTAERTKPLVQAFISTIPLIKILQRNACIAEFSGTLATLLDSGIPLTDALDSTAKAMRNRILRKRIYQMIPHISAGETLGEVIGKSGKMFPHMVTTLVTVGEESGTFVKTMEYISDLYQSELDNSVKAITTAMEPILLIIIGSIVAFTVLGIITPIYNVTSAVG